MGRSVADNLLEVRDSLAEAALAAGRDPASVRLLAVSKTFPASDVLEAYAAGQRLFGENRVQELEVKAPALPKDIEWHLIGHLQSNKAAKAVALASWIHSIDSERLLERAGRIAAESGARPGVLLEVNVSGEESKFGARDLDAALRLAEKAAGTASLRFAGLMAMAPLDADEALRRRVFSGLRELRDRMERELSIKLPELSMGMSLDFKEAVMEGSTIVRIGTAIFGGRY